MEENKETYDIYVVFEETIEEALSDGKTESKKEMLTGWHRTLKEAQSRMLNAISLENKLHGVDNPFRYRRIQIEDGIKYVYIGTDKERFCTWPLEISWTIKPAKVIV